MPRPCCISLSWGQQLYHRGGELQRRLHTCGINADEKSGHKWGEWVCFQSTYLITHTVNFHVLFSDSKQRLLSRRLIFIITLMFNFGFSGVSGGKEKFLSLYCIQTKKVSLYGWNEWKTMFWQFATGLTALWITVNHVIRNSLRQRSMQHCNFDKKL